MAKQYTPSPKKKNPAIALDYGKIPPQALDLEEAVLGAIMLEKDAILIGSGYPGAWQLL